MTKVHLIFSEHGRQISGSAIADVNQCGTVTAIEYTVMTQNPDEIHYPDKVVQWSGDENDVSNFREGCPDPNPGWSFEQYIASNLTSGLNFL